MSDVTIKYKGQSIATMDASGTKTLGTQGKYCEGDIAVEYTKPAAPSGTKQISITENGTVTENVTNFASAEITVDVQGGGGHTQFTFDNTITTVGGRDNAHALVVGLLPYQQIEIVGYGYLVGGTTVTNQRLNYGFTQEMSGAFYLNKDGDTTTQFRITGEFANGAMKYVYSYPGKGSWTKTVKIMYDAFAFHWLTVPSADTPVVIHATVTASY